MADIIWRDPAEIEFKITPFLDLPAVKDGDWDIERRIPFEGTAKYRAIVQRFVEGREWLETDLFTQAYVRRMEQDGHILGARSLGMLAADYKRRIDPLYKAMKRDGFRTETFGGRKFPLPALLIGRDGEVFIGNQGNHRLAIAKVLGLDRIAGKIKCRHSLWNG